MRVVSCLRLCLGCAALLAGACGGGEITAPAEPEPNRVLALMLEMQGSWEALLEAQGREDLVAVRSAAAALRRSGEEPAFLAGREEEVWRRYAQLLLDGAARVGAAEDAGEVRRALQGLEKSCNECHRRYQ